MELGLKHENKYFRCADCQAKFDAADREKKLKQEAEWAANARQHSEKAARAAEVVEELRATNKHAWQVAVRICNDSWYAEYGYRSYRYELSDLAEAVGLSEENTYQALKRLADGIIEINASASDGPSGDTATGLCLHAESLKRVCKCCRSFYVDVDHYVGQAIREQ